MILKNILDIESKYNDCTGCQLCGAVCPKNAISIILNDDGFYIPIVEEEKCVNCGICRKACYKYDSYIKMTDNNSKIPTYAAMSKSNELLENTSSGGIAALLADEFFHRGYKVIGVSYDSANDIAKTDIAVDDEQLKTFRGSKYIQSHCIEAWKEVLKDDSQQCYLVFGTPCQIYSLSKFLQHKGWRERFLLVDFFCHGCPSMNLWKKSIEEIKHNNNMDKLKKVEFRSKKRGWHEFCIYCEDIGMKKFLGRNSLDDFFFMFFDNQVLCDSCYDCKLRSTIEYTDIRLGDFWGRKYDLNKTGVSVVVPYTYKGREAMKLIYEKVNIEECTFSEAIEAQSYGKKYNPIKSRREYAFKLLKSDMPMHLVTRQYRKCQSFGEIIKYYSKKAVYILPQKVRFYIKQIYHRMVSKSNW